MSSGHDGISWAGILRSYVTCALVRILTALSGCHTTQPCACPLPALCCCACLQDISAIRSSRSKIFQLHDEGKLQAWVDVGHGYKGVEQIPQAIEYMLQGAHTGKVVIPL